MTSTERVAEMTNGVRSAVDRSADLWRRGTDQVTAGTGALVKLPPAGFDRATEQYFDYLQRSLEVNRQLAKQWADALSSLSDASQTQAGWLGDAVQGHTAAIRDWLTAEIDTVQQATAARVEAMKRANREQIRSRYQELTKAELADELGRRDLPKTGTVDELVERLVDSDTP